MASGAAYPPICAQTTRSRAEGRWRGSRRRRNGHDDLRSGSSYRSDFPSCRDLLEPRVAGTASWTPAKSLEVGRSWAGSSTIYWRAAASTRGVSAERELGDPAAVDCAHSTPAPVSGCSKPKWQLPPAPGHSSIRQGSHYASAGSPVGHPGRCSRCAELHRSPRRPRSTPLLKAVRRSRRLYRNTVVMRTTACFPYSIGTVVRVLKRYIAVTHRRSLRGPHSHLHLRACKSVDMQTVWTVPGRATGHQLPVPITP
jgi:hypothetical protein